MKLLVFSLAFLAGCPPDAEKPDDTDVETVCTDDDGDTFCQEDGDCEDGDRNVFPGAVEACNDEDDNCDGAIDEGVLITFHVDADADGFGATTGDTVDACEAPAGYAAEATDCDDASASINPGIAEVCDSVDNNCDGTADENLLASFWMDGDLDGFGDVAQQVSACTQPEGYTTNADDCADGDAAISPAAVEACDGIDNDCDGEIDQDATTRYYVDNDGDGYGLTDIYIDACEQPEGYAPLPDDCDDDRADNHPDADEYCNFADDDCDGLMNEDDPDLLFAPTWYYDGDGDGEGGTDVTIVACDRPAGYEYTADDCDDSDASINTTGTEHCDGVDENCDGLVDNGGLDGPTFYADDDADGYGDASDTTSRCELPSGYSTDATDCDDTDATSYPGAAETCDTVDNDCDGDVDEDPTVTFYADLDSDGFGDASSTTLACDASAGWVADDTDCDDTDGAISPDGVEECDAVDNDCDGVIDWGEQAVTFDGAGDYVQMIDNAPLDVGTADFTVEGWIEQGNSVPGTIYSKGGNDGIAGYVLASNGTYLEAKMIAPSGDVLTCEGVTLVSDETWHHVAMTADRDGLMSLYVDGRSRRAASSPRWTACRWRTASTRPSASGTATS